MSSDTRLRDQAPAPQAALPSQTAPFLWFATRSFRVACTASVLLQALATCCTAFVPWALSSVIRGAMQNAGAANLLEKTAPAAGLFLLLILSETVLGRMRDAVQMRTRPRMRLRIVAMLYSHVQHHSHRFFSDTYAGSLAHRVSEVAQGSAQIIWTLMSEVWHALLLLLIAIVVLMHTQAALGLFYLVWSVLFAGTSLWLASRAEPANRAAAAARSQSTGLIIDTLSNQQSVRLFAREAYETDLLKKSQAHELGHILEANQQTEYVRWIQNIFSVMLKAGTLALTIWLLQHQAIDVPQMLLAVTFSFLIINEVQSLTRRFFDLFDAAADVANGLKVIAQPHEIPNAENAIAFQASVGKMQLEHVSFSYSKGQATLHDINLTIEPGEKIALTGQSGAGKSTLLNLMLRQYEVQSGRILIDGVDLRDMTQASLRDTIGYIPQDPSLFHRTLMENIRYGRPDATDEQVQHAARLAGAHEFIQSLPSRYDTVVGERGVKLSGGQRQRVVLARLLLKDAPILILDEATSSLDALTEQMILETLGEALAHKTIILITHRHPVVWRVDRTLRLHHGRLEEVPR